MTALMMSAFFGAHASCRVLCEQKADPNLKTLDGTSALIFAVSQNNVESVRLFTTILGDTLDQTTTANQNVTALYLACQENFVECVDLLLAHSTVALEQCKNGGVSPLYIASHEGHDDCVAKLLAAKAEVRGGVSEAAGLAEPAHAHTCTSFAHSLCVGRHVTVSYDFLFTPCDRAVLTCLCHYYWRS